MTERNKKQYPVAIIGAGICGLSLAHRLKSLGLEIVIIEKSAGLGGRFATRRTEGGIVDHGISWLELKGNVVPEFAADLVARGILIRSPTEPDKWVCPLGMNHIAKHLAQGITVEKNRRVTKISVAPGAAQWRLALEGQGALLTASAVVCTQPVPQSLELLQNSFPGQLPGVVVKLETIRYRPTLVLIGNLGEEKGKKEFLSKAPFELIVRGEEKGLITSSATTTIYFDEKFSTHWFDRPDLEVLREAKHRFEKTYGASLASPQIKKWRYARAVSPCREPFLAAPIHPSLFFAGDGFAGGEVEGALRSAYALASQFN